MRGLLLSALSAAIAVGAVEAAAVVAGWTPPFWVLLAAPVVAGIAAFLISGRLRAVRLQRRQTARRARPDAGRPASARAVPVRAGHVTVLRRERVAPSSTGAGQTELVPVHVDDGRLTR
jgi:hypothetical protein